MKINNYFKEQIKQLKKDFTFSSNNSESGTEELKEEIVHSAKIGTVYAFAFVKWLILSTATGIICGLAGTAFFKAVAYATNIREDNDYIFFLLPIAGLIIIGIYHLFGVRHDKGTNLVLDSIHSHEQIPGTMAPLIFAGTVITHLFGGSAGREGAAIQMGGCLGVFLGKHMKMTEKDINIITMCGMSAVFSAMFGTPITATIFSMEVISVGMFHYSAFLPCILASAVSYGIANFFGIQGESFVLKILPETNINSCMLVILMSIMCGIIAIVFCKSIHLIQHCYRRFFHNQYIRIFAGGCLVCVVSIILNTRDYSGAGFNLISMAFESPSDIGPETFVLKIILTALTLGAGFKGGEIVPALCVGATFGCVMAPLLGINPAFGAAICMICMFCGVTNCPIASIFLTIEMIGQNALLLFCIAISVSYVFSGYVGLYNSQKILYSKLHAEYINTHSH